jgi:hypothetical protein
MTKYRLTDEERAEQDTLWAKEDSGAPLTCEEERRLMELVKRTFEATPKLSRTLSALSGVPWAEDVESAGE